MRVGVYIGNIDSSTGGGYTFQDDIFEAWLKLRSESKHNFVLLAQFPELLRTQLNGAQLEIVPSHIALRPSKWARRVRHRLPPLRSKIDYSVDFQRGIQRSGIDFLWPLTPNDFAPVDVPYMFTVWDLQHRFQPWFPEVSEGGQWDKRERYFSRILQRAAFVLVGTQAGKDEVTRFYQVPSERVRVLPHPTPEFALAAPPDTDLGLLQKYQLPTDYLFYPAQFWSHKNHTGLLLGLHVLREKYGLKLPLVLVGSDKGNLTYLKQLVGQLNLSEQVHFLGFVSREELIALYRNAFALTYMTFFGPENLPPLEAFALGCPVIASNVSGAQEQLGDAALLVDPKDEHQIAQAINSIYRDANLRRQLIQRGSVRAQCWTATDFMRASFVLLDEFSTIRRTWSPEQGL